MSATYSTGCYNIGWIFVKEEGKTIATFTITKILKRLKLYETEISDVEKLADAVKIAQLFLAYIKSENLV